MREIVRRLVLTTRRAGTVRRIQEPDLQYFKIPIFTLEYTKLPSIDVHHEDCHVIEATSADLSNMIHKDVPEHVTLKHKDDSVAIVPKHDTTRSSFDLVLYLPSKKHVYLFKIVNIPVFGNININIKENVHIEGMTTEVVFLAVQHGHLVTKGNTIQPIFAYQPVQASISFVEDYFWNDMHMITRTFRRLEEAYKELEEMKVGKNELDFMGEDLSGVRQKIGLTKGSREAIRWQFGSED